MNKGFTLIELMVTVVIIGILSAIAFANYDTWRVAAYRAEAKNGLGMMIKLQEIYRLEKGQYYAPTTSDPLGVLAKGYGAKHGTTAHSCDGNKLGFKLKSCGEAAGEGGPRYRYYFTQLSPRGHVAIANAHQDALGFECEGSASYNHVNYTPSGTGTPTPTVNGDLNSANSDLVIQSDLSQVAVGRDLLSGC